MTNLSDTLLVSISFSDKDTGVLIVGRKRKNQSIEIINAFQGGRGTGPLQETCNEKGEKT